MRACPPVVDSHGFSRLPARAQARGLAGGELLAVDADVAGDLPAVVVEQAHGLRVKRHRVRRPVLHAAVHSPPSARGRLLPLQRALDAAAAAAGEHDQQDNPGASHAAYIMARWPKRNSKSPTSWSMRSTR